MVDKYNRSLVLFRLLLVSGLSLILLIILNLGLDYYLAKAILIPFIMFFLPGYALVNILFEKRPEIPELLVLSIGISISVFILIAMSVHFAGIKIGIENILNPVATLSLILGLIDFAKNRMRI